MQERIHVYLYDFELTLLYRLAATESLSRTIARLIKMEAAAERPEPPAGVYRSANGDVYTVEHLKEPAMICFECKIDKPTQTCNHCAHPICDTDWATHAKGCFSFPQHVTPGPVEGPMNPSVAFPATKPGAS